MATATASPPAATRYQSGRVGSTLKGRELEQCYSGPVDEAAYRHGDGSYVYPNPHFAYEGGYVNGLKQGAPTAPPRPAPTSPEDALQRGRRRRGVPQSACASSPLTAAAPPRAGHGRLMIGDGYFEGTFVDDEIQVCTELTCSASMLSWPSCRHCAGDSCQPARPHTEHTPSALCHARTQIRGTSHLREAAWGQCMLYYRAWLSVHHVQCSLSNCLCEGHRLQSALMAFRLATVIFTPRD